MRECCVSIRVCAPGVGCMCARAVCARVSVCMAWACVFQRSFHQGALVVFV